ncbi:hypothetical protein [Cysteiniphilum litorale]|uniref:hypothetical protein n=1 Tax=Cysteiniphilum litorale TaxID=2056700 RepID=UPI003F881B1D
MNTTNPANNAKNAKQSIALMLEKLDSIQSEPVGCTLKKQQYADLKAVSNMAKQLKIQAALKDIKEQLAVAQVKALSADKMFAIMSSISDQIDEVFNTARSNMKKDTTEQSSTKNNDANGKGYYKKAQQNAYGNNYQASSEPQVQTEDELYA